jgi:hypothetical protein
VKMLVAVGLAALLACALAGCSSSDPHPYDGPLSSATGAGGPIPRGGECATRFYGQRQAFGIAVFRNYGHSTVVLDRVILLHAHNERLIGSDVIPGTRSWVGAVTWPPNWVSVRGAWKTRQPVRGYQVAPGKSLEMVLGVEPAGPRNATSEGQLVYCHDHAGSYVAPSYFGMQVTVGKNGCAAS